MRDYGKVSPQFWIGETGKQLRGDANAQLLALYLMTCPHSNMIGVFHCPVLYMAHETGLGAEGATKALARLSEVGFCEYDEDSETVFVIRMAAYQIGDELKPTDNRVAGLRKEVARMPEARMKSRFLAVYGVAFGLVDPTQKGKGGRSPSKAPPKPRAGTGTGKEDLSGKPDPAGELLDYLNQQTGRAYRKVDTNLSMLKARLKESTPDEIRAVIDAKVAQWGGNPKMDEFLRPKTLFAASNFENYLGAIGSGAPSHGISACEGLI